MKCGREEKTQGSLKRSEREKRGRKSEKNCVEKVFRNSDPMGKGSRIPVLDSAERSPRTGGREGRIEGQKESEREKS